YPWGEEALTKARRENKVIFLSIGYSSCHWCHVMERESFLDEEIAALLNEHFVCIKVDREERPDVDSLYMTAVQLINQRGGWPLSVFLTPDAKPFFGATYFPARDNDRPGVTGFLTIVRRIHELWGESPEKLREDADRVAAALKTELEGRRPLALKPLDRTFLNRVQEELAEQFDEDFGGFGYSVANPQRPKFPEPSNLLFLIHRARDQQLDDDARQQARHMLVRTLHQMAWGGIHDHVGGGFHRYSVDRYWRIPHFEKMLYDNGQLATAYAEAFALTGDVEFRLAAERLAEFVLRELRDPQGGFYATLDAESAGEEGHFYRWEKEEVEKLLGNDFALYAAVFGFERAPNFEDKFYVIRRRSSLAELAETHELTVEQLVERLNRGHAKLFAAREQRPRPLTDRKVLTGWNGLMIRGLADAGRLLENPKYLEAAEQAADFALKNLRTDDGRLYRTWTDGQAKLNAYVSDYAFLIDGLIALHEATGDTRWLDAATALNDRQLELFWDEANGGFYFTSDDHESLLARIKNPVDAAEPAGNSVAAANLLYLGKKLNRPELIEKARQTVQSVSGLLEVSPAVAPRLAIVIGQLSAPKPE
ncbi:MAG: thioredoxin domain-containing protein, partial [Planctomycetales bacterium]|nr:thioredoxin domain-containing protein [Planctomycetales bacterium]